MPYEILAELKVIVIRADMYFRQVDKQKTALLHIQDTAVRRRGGCCFLFGSPAKAPVRASILYRDLSALGEDRACAIFFHLPPIKDRK